MLPDLFKFIYLFILFRTVPVAYEVSQATGRVGAVAAGLCHSHSKARSEPCLQPIAELTAMSDPQSTEQGQELNPQPQDS